MVSNTETLAQLALIARHGAGWFRTLGTAGDPGTRLVTVGGAVNYPGVVEIAGGTTVGQLIKASGGLATPLGGVLLGGYAGSWLGPDAVDLRLDAHLLQERGMSLGSGIVFLLPESACIVAEVAAVARWLQRESAGQCGPCIHGLQAIAGALEELCGTGDRHGAYARIERWCELVIKRGACGLPDGAASFVTTALRTFRPQFDDHARHGACDACVGRGYCQPPHWTLRTPHERQADRQPDRLHRSRPLRRALPGADLARRLGLSGHRGRAAERRVVEAR